MRVLSDDCPDVRERSFIVIINILKRVNHERSSRLRPFGEQLNGYDVIVLRRIRKSRKGAEVPLSRI